MLDNAKEDIAQRVRRIHIISTGEKWKVKKSWCTRSSRVFSRKTAAVRYATKDLLSNCCVIIHKVDGTVEKIIQKEDVNFK